MNDKDIKKLLDQLGKLLEGTSLGGQLQEAMQIETKAIGIIKAANRQMDRYTVGGWDGKRKGTYEKTMSRLSRHFDDKTDIVSYGKAISNLRRSKREEIYKALRGTPLKKLRYLFSKKYRKGYVSTVDMLETAITHFALIEVEKDIKDRYEISEGAKNVKSTKRGD